MKKILLIIYIIISISLGIITFYSSKLFSQRLPEIFQEEVYPSSSPSSVNCSNMCNGTRPIGCKSHPNVKAKGVLKGSTPKGCCIECSEDKLTCLKQ